jgi:hypothetical protein
VFIVAAANEYVFVLPPVALTPKRIRLSVGLIPIKGPPGDVVLLLNATAHAKLEAGSAVGYIHAAMVSTAGNEKADDTV